MSRCCFCDLCGFDCWCCEERPCVCREHRRPAAKAADMAKTQYSCWASEVSSRDVISTLRRNLHSSGISSGLHVDRRAISSRTVTWWVSQRCPLTLLCSEKLRYSHCECEILSSFVISIFIQSAPVERLLTETQYTFW